MEPHNFALVFTCLMLSNVAHMAILKQSSLHIKVAYVGESVTLPCSCQDVAAVMLYWFKQTLGQKPKLVSTFYKHKVDNGTFYDEFKDTMRFSLDTESSKHHLKLSYLQISDSATYYCLSNNLLRFEFCTSITVSVEGSGVNIPALFHQSASETIQHGDSVTLNCTVHTGTCDGEHRVYWFRHSEESHPGLIYSHGDGQDQCERKPDTQTHTCVYNLPMESLNPSQPETYYCAVASCGYIVFGNGTMLEFKDEVDPLDLVHVLSGALAFNSTLVILLAISVCKMNKRSCQCAGSSEAFSATCPANIVLREDGENLHYASLSEQNISRSRGQRDNTRSECVYSTVRQ